MNQYFKTYLMSVVAAGMLLTIMLSIIPKGIVHKIAGIVGGLLLVITAISPLLDFNGDVISQAVSKYIIEAENIQTGIEIGSKELLCQVIKDQCESYILDKADSMGMAIEIEIEMNEKVQYPYPIHVTVRGNWTVSEQMYLCRYIADSLGVPEEQQEWLLM